MTSSDITAICSVVIALCALIFSVIQSRRNEKVTRLSNRPKLQSKFVRNRSSFDDITPGIYVENRGLGPAILDECQLVVGNKKFNVANFKELEDYISMLGIERVEHGRTVIRPGTYVLPGISLDIISFSSTGLSKVNNQIWKDTEVHGQYSSIFAESFSLISNRRD